MSVRPSQPSLKGVDLEGFRILDLIAESGVGSIWRAHDTNLDIPVAVKVLAPHLAEDQRFLVRFLREARAIAKLEHPNIARVFQATKREFQGQTLRMIVMEHIEGRNLDEYRKSFPEGRVPAERAVEIALEIAKALHFAHSKSVIHRDIKPSNILITKDRERAKVVDFGLAQVQTRSEDESDPAASTQNGVVHGSPHYLSPEQLKREAVDGRADIYSLGIVLFELLCGCLPFDGDDTLRIAYQQVQEDLPFENCPEWHPLVRETLEGMCQKVPKDRITLEAAIKRFKGFIGRRESATDVIETDLRGERSNISTPNSSFIGRGSALESLKMMILEDEHRLVSVLGPGGVGKTRLAREFGLSTLEEKAFEGGAYIADLSEAENVEEICQAIAAALGISLAHSDPLVQIERALSHRKAPTLLILDTFEHLTDCAAKTVGILTQRTEKVSYLVTSREPLHLAGEQVFRLDPLPYKDGDLNSPAITLFIDRAKEAKSDFEVDFTNQSDVEALVRALDGLPLAIELAAVSVRELEPEQIGEGIHAHIDEISSAIEGVMPRKATLRGTVDWSWTLLEPWEELALAQCSTFKGGFFLEAAESVIDLSSIADAPFEIDAIEALCEKSLLYIQEVSELGGEIRYRMLESIRVYAKEKLSLLCSDHQRKALELRHAAHYAAYAEGWDALIRTRREREAMTRIEIELANIGLAMERVIEDYPKVSARLLLATNQVRFSRGPIKGLIEAHMRLIDVIGPEPTVLRSELLNRAYQFLSRFGDKEQADRVLAMAQESATLLVQEEESLENLESLATIKNLRGNVMLQRGLTKDAEALYREAEAIYRRTGNRSREARNTTNLGAALEKRGLVSEAVEKYERATELFKSVDDLRGVAIAMTNLASAFTKQGKFERGLEIYRKASDMYREAGNVDGLAISLGNLGAALMHIEQYEEAWVALSEAAELSRNIGAQTPLGQWLLMRAWVVLFRPEEEVRDADLLGVVIDLLEAKSIQVKAGLDQRIEYFETIASISQAHLRLARRCHDAGRETASAGHEKDAKTFAQEAESVGGDWRDPESYVAQAEEIDMVWEWVREGHSGLHNAKS